jgi:hypothetical protein
LTHRISSASADLGFTDPRHRQEGCMASRIPDIRSRINPPIDDLQANSLPVRARSGTLDGALSIVNIGLRTVNPGLRPFAILWQALSGSFGCTIQDGFQCHCPVESGSGCMTSFGNSPALGFFPMPAVKEAGGL